MFDAFKQKTIQTFQGIGEKLSDDANDIVDPGHRFGPLWEANETIENCRMCNIKFQQLVKRKHHCRNCAGVFCDNCCQLTTPNDGDASSEQIRLCGGCKRGETPGDIIKNMIRGQLESEQGRSDQNTLDKLGSKVVAKVTETLRVPVAQFNIGKMVALSRGSGYPDSGSSSSIAPPISGYFEFLNKSSQFCCIKLLNSGSNRKFEIPRPSYIAVPPGQSLYGTFNPDEESLDLMILYDNPHPIPSETSVNFDTKAQGASIQRLSLCARVDLFTKAIVYSVPSKGKNVLLKYKGNGFAEPRFGDSVQRVGIFAKLQGRRFADNKIDYATNINSMSICFSVSS